MIHLAATLKEIESKISEMVDDFIKFLPVFIQKELLCIVKKQIRDRTLFV